MAGPGVWHARLVAQRVADSTLRVAVGIVRVRSSASVQDFGVPAPANIRSVKTAETSAIRVS